MRIRPPRYSGAKDLNGGQPEPIAGRDLRVRIVADDEHLVRAKFVSIDDLPKNALFSVRPSLLYRVDVNRFEARCDPERVDLALLKSTKSRRHQKALCRELRELTENR